MLFVKVRTAKQKQNKQKKQKKKQPQTVYMYYFILFQMLQKYSSGIHTTNLETILVYTMYFKVVVTLQRDKRRENKWNNGGGGGLFTKV